VFLSIHRQGARPAVVSRHLSSFALLLTLARYQLSMQLAQRSSPGAIVERLDTCRDLACAQAHAGQEEKHIQVDHSQVIVKNR
jgi:hypothetical protein